MTTELQRYDHHDYTPGTGDRIYREPSPPEVVQVDPTGGRLVSWAHAMHAAKQLADALAQTTFVPQHFRGKPDDAAAAIMYGDEIGFTPGQSLQNVYVVSGKPSLYARAMVALVLSKGHEIWTEASSPQRVIVCGKRRGSQKVERVEWTRAKAEQAGYTSNKKYDSDPEAMLYARASADVARRLAPDALAGIAYTVEELELAGDAEPSVTVTQAGPPAKKTAKRAPRKKTEPAREADEPDLDDKPAEPTYGTGGVTSDQIKAIATLMGRAEIVDRDAALRYVADVIGREVDSRNELTVQEASRVIDALKVEIGEVLDAFPDEPKDEQ